MIEVYEYTKKQKEAITTKGVGFFEKDGKFYLPKDFVDNSELLKGVYKQITIEHNAK